MARRYLGYGITNSSGVAKLEYLYNPTTGQTSSSTSAHSYTGVGAGKIDIVAESGSLQSEPLPVLDTIVMDLNNSRSTSYYYVSRGALTEADGGKTFTRNTSGTAYFTLASDGTYANRLTFVTDVCLEFDLLDTANTRIGMINETASTTEYTGFNITTAGKYKLEVYNTGFKLLRDGTIIVNNTTSNNGSTVSLVFYLQGESNSISFKDLKIYPI